MDHNSKQPVISEAWRTLRNAIPDRGAKAVSLRLHVSRDHVLKWRREPLSDDAPLSNGQRSPLDRICDLIDAVFLSHPAGAGLIVEHVRSHYDDLLEASARGGAEWDRREHAAALLREAVEAVNCLNLDTPDDETIQELIEARNALDVAIKGVRRAPALGGKAERRIGESTRESGSASRRLEGGNCEK